MRDYAKLSPFFWIRGSGRKLRGDAMAQVVASYLSTCPASNMIGIFYVSIATIADDTGHSRDDVRAALVRIETARYASYDHNAELVWIPNHARFEIGATMSTGDKRRKKVLAELAHVEGHPFRAEFQELYGDVYGIAPERSFTQPPPPPAPASQTKGHAGFERNPDGASRDHEQDRTGQDRAGQDRAGQDRAEGHRFALGTGSVEAKAVFESAVAEATGRPFSLGSAPFYARDLCDAINVHAPPGSMSEALAWLRTVSAAWVRTLDGKSTSVVPSKLLDWLNAGKPDRRTRGRAGAIVQPGDNRAWKVPEDMP